MKKDNGSTRRRKRQEWVKFVNSSIAIQNQKKVWSYLYPGKKKQTIDNSVKQGESNGAGQET